MSNKKHVAFKDDFVGESTETETPNSQIMASRGENYESSKRNPKDLKDFRRRSLFKTFKDYNIADAWDFELTDEVEWTLPSRLDCMVVSDRVLPFIGKSRFMLVHDTFGRILTYLSDLGYLIVKVCFIDDILFIFISDRKAGEICHFEELDFSVIPEATVKFGGYWKDMSNEASVVYLYSNTMYIRHGGFRHEK